MPRLAYFYGLTIAMNYNDHAPPHFHVVYGEYEVLVGISPIIILRGSLPGRSQSMVFEWAVLHQEELMHNWMLAREHQRLQPIVPLD